MTGDTYNQVKFGGGKKTPYDVIPSQTGSSESLRPGTGIFFLILQKAPS